MTLLKDMPTHTLGDDMQMALYSQRKGKFNYQCMNCNRKHSGVFYCEFCLANELYARRKTMAFMRLDLCIQAAVCLIAKTGNSGAQARGENTKYVGHPDQLSPVTGFKAKCVFIDEVNTGDSENDKD